MIHCSYEALLFNFYSYLSERLDYEYNNLSNFFEVRCILLNIFIIAHRIEQAKELLLYYELTLTEIAAKLYYSNVVYLSTQFKKVIGLTPLFFKQMKN